MEKRKNLYWGEHIDSIEDCEKLINETHWFLIAMAGIMCVLGLALKQFFILLPDMIFMIIIALLLKKYQSRSISTLIFIYSVFTCVVTFGNKLNLPFAKDFGGGTNIFLAIIFVYVAFKTMQATYKLFKLRNLAVSWKNFCIKSVIFVVLLIVLGFIALVAGALTGSDTLIGLFAILALFSSMFIAYAGIFPMSNKLKIKYVKGMQDEVLPCNDCKENEGKDCQNEPLYNTVPLWKVIVLLTLTFGVYTIPWAYNLWKQGQKKYDKKISPFWRSIFISFTSFKLFPLINDYLMNPPKKETEIIDNDIINRYINDSEIKPFPATCFAWIYLMFSSVANALNKMGSYSQSFTVAELLALILALIPIVIIQSKINATNHRYGIHVKNDTWTWKTTGFVVLWFVLVFILSIILTIISYS